MRLPLKLIAPESISQKPAIMRKSVVLPHPDGPSSVKNSPSRISSETSRTARTSPKERLTQSIVTVVIGTIPRDAWPAEERSSHPPLQGEDGGGAGVPNVRLPFSFRGCPHPRPFSLYRRREGYRVSWIRSLILSSVAARF